MASEVRTLKPRPVATSRGVEKIQPAPADPPVVDRLGLRATELRAPRPSLAETAGLGGGMVRREILRRALLSHVKHRRQASILCRINSPDLSGVLSMVADPVAANERWIAQIANDLLGDAGDNSTYMLIGTRLVFAARASRATYLDLTVDLNPIYALPDHERHVALIHALRAELRDAGCAVAND